MNRRAVCSYMLIFLSAILLLYYGLSLSGQGLREISGRDGFTEVVSIDQCPAGVWMITFAGRDWPVSYDQMKKNLFFRR